MGLTLPKLPHIHLFASNAESTGSGFLYPSQKRKLKKPSHDVPPPQWVDDIEGYHIASCRWHEDVSFGLGNCLVVGYHPNDFGNSEDRGFVKIWAIDENPHWKYEGTPFSQMKGIWKEIHEDKKTYSLTYEMSEDGRVYSDMMGFPSDNNINDAIYDIGQMYDVWKHFPNAPDWDTVGKLSQARQDVDQMREETRHGWVQKHIDNMRKEIQDTQKRIADAERGLNVMYERAADGMDLLEKYGIKVDLDAETTEEEKKAVEDNSPIASTDLDFSSLYPSDALMKFKGHATIMRNCDGSYLVHPESQDPPKIGNIVVDMNNGLSAVYSVNGKWEVLNVP